MVEIQCSSCHTRYRIDERVLPEDTPTFKCSRCGHVFSVEPRTVKVSAPSKGAASKPPPSKVRRELKVVPPKEAPAAPAIEEPAKAAAPPSKQRAAAEAPAPSQVAPPAEPAQGASQPTDEPAPEPSPPVAGDPLARSFGTQVEENEPGESLSFDFSVEAEDHAVGSQTIREGDEWEEAERPMSFDSEPAQAPDDLPSLRASLARAPANAPRDEEREFAAAEEVERLSLGHPIHSSGFFLACFFFVALAFGALSLVIAGAPDASTAVLAKLPAVGERFVNPASPAVLVALRDVHAEYRNISGDQRALVVTGQAMNVGSQPLHEVQIAVRLLDGAQQELARQAIYCGNSLSGRMIGEMTPRELQFFQKLGPPKAFVLQPSAAYGFAIVFVGPPRGIKHFALQVERAEPAIPGATGDAPSAAPGA